MADDAKAALLAAKKSRIQILKEKKRLRDQNQQAKLQPVVKSKTEKLDIDSLISDIPDPSKRPKTPEVGETPIADNDIASNNANIRYSRHFLTGKCSFPRLNRLPKLTKAKRESVDIKPIECTQSYQKITQTDESAIQQAIEDEKLRLENEEEEKRKKELESDEKKDLIEEDTKENEDEDRVVQELSEDQKEAIVNSRDFRAFFDRASRIMEKAICDVDVAFPYSGDGLDNMGDNAGELLRLNRVFEDERWTAHRAITSFDINTKYPELFLTSYNNNTESVTDPEGTVLIWNKKFAKPSPEYIFHCQSPVMSACFARFQPNLILGGTYSGQVVAWDMRASKRTPIQRSPLSSTAHTHPVYCLQVVGTQNAHNLISIATDGRLCSWSLDMLSQPQDTLDLQIKSKPVAVTAMNFPLGEVNSFLVGSEDGTLYSASRHGSKAGVNDTFEGHHGPITGLDCNRAVGQGDFSNLFISSSIDWTVKLWNTKLNKPLYSFENASDYIFDVKWSPVNPAVFASVDAMGRIDVWNINTDTEVPVVSVQTSSRTALNRLAWAANGKELHVGDCEGRVYIYDLKEKLALPHNEEWKRMNDTLNEMQQRITESPLVV